MSVFPPALFLDRDGILMEDFGYIGDPEKVKIIEAGAATLRWAQAKGYKLIVLTNQSGVARGKFTLADVDKVNERLVLEWKNLGVALDDIIVSPALEGEDRKPRPGMALKAATKHGIDLSRSIMVGDKDSDVLEDVPVRSFLIQGQYPIRRTDRVATWVEIQATLEAQEFLCSL
jgi:D-glycero-D-manno-heptose 1,7-bisphosphate phosphatase